MRLDQVETTQTREVISLPENHEFEVKIDVYTKRI